MIENVKNRVNEGTAPEFNSERPIRGGSYSIPKPAGKTSDIAIFMN